MFRMEDEGEDRYRKRTRDDQLSNEQVENNLEFSLKKVRISKQVPGQIRLQQDINDCNEPGRIPGLENIKFDSKNPLTVHVRLMDGKEFSIVAGRFYPHQAPAIWTIPSNERIDLPILRNWLPVYTLSQILAQLLCGDRGIHSMEMEEA